MKQSKRNQRNAVMQAERRSEGKPPMSKYERKKAARMASTNAMSEELAKLLADA